MQNCITYSLPPKLPNIPVGATCKQGHYTLYLTLKFYYAKPCPILTLLLSYTFFTPSLCQESVGEKPKAGGQLTKFHCQKIPIIYPATIWHVLLCHFCFVQSANYKVTCKSLYWTKFVVFASISLLWKFLKVWFAAQYFQFFSNVMWGGEHKQHFWVYFNVLTEEYLCLRHLCYTNCCWV